MDFKLASEFNSFWQIEESDGNELHTGGDGSNFFSAVYTMDDDNLTSLNGTTLEARLRRSGDSGWASWLRVYDGTYYVALHIHPDKCCAEKDPTREQVLYTELYPVYPRKA